jgi:hypothetical protein
MNLLTVDEDTRIRLVGALVSTHQESDVRPYLLDIIALRVDGALDSLDTSLGSVG